MASEVTWPEKRVRLVQQTSFPEEARTSIIVHSENPVEFVLRVRAPHWAERIAVSVNGRPERVAAEGDGYLALNRTWKSRDRVEVSLPMTLREEPVAGSPELATLAYGPLVLACQMGRDGLSRDMIEGSLGPKMDRLAPVPMPKFETGHDAGKETKNGVQWAKKNEDEELRFRTAGQAQDFGLKPLYRVMDERYSVYWQRGSKA